ncbi:ankyrin repeat protein [Apiospora sp. TS-2023a]
MACFPKLGSRWKWKGRRSRANVTNAQCALSGNTNHAFVQGPNTHMQPVESVATCHPTAAETVPTVKGTGPSQTTPGQGPPKTVDANPDVWPEAYEVFAGRVPDLAAAYHEHLSTISAADTSGPTDHFTKKMSPGWVNSVVDQLQEKRLKEQWGFEFRGKDIKIRAQIEKLAKVFVWCNGIVKDALSAQPYAALAWSGVSILFPLLTAVSAQHEAMLVGFESAHRVLVYWRAYQALLSDNVSISGNRTAWDALVDLYSHIFEFQARVICHLSSAPLSRAWDKLTGKDDWQTMSSRLTGRSDHCKKCTDITHQAKAQETFEAHLRQMYELQTAVRQIYDLMEEKRKQWLDNLDDQRETKLLGDLASDHEGRKNLVPTKVKGTCSWFVDDPKFREWRDSAESSLLWVSAGPGCGKSVLSRSLIDECQLSMSPATAIVCHFFFKEGNSDASHSYDALSAIVHQVFIRDLTGQCIGRALSRHKNELSRETALNLWDILLECASTQGSGEIICVLDALDECMERGRQIIIDNLRKLYSNDGAAVRRTCKLKFLVTSRPYDTIEQSIGMIPDVLHLRLDGDAQATAINRDINLIIDERIPQLLSRFSPDDCQLVSDSLKQMSNRTYLWLRLTFDIIEGSPISYGRLCDVNTLLRKLPQEHADAYDRLLDLKSDPIHTTNLFKIMLSAERPLGLEEMNCALAYAGTDGVSEVELWPDDSFKGFVENLSGLLVTVHDSKLSFIHQTVREFLTEGPNEMPTDGSKWSWRGRLTIPKCHHTMSLSCIRYLSIPELAKSLDNRTPRRNYPFFQYANCYWPLHYRGQDDESRSNLLTEARDLCRDDRKWMTSAKDFMLVVMYQYDLVRPSWSECPDLVVAAYNGLDLVVRSIMNESDLDIDVYWKTFGTALKAACFQGHHDVVTTLLQHGARVNTEKERYGTPITTAIRCGHVGVIKAILENRGQEVIVTQEDATFAAGNIHGKEIIPLLVQARGNQIITEEVFGEALEKGDEEFITLLLPMLPIPIVFGEDLLMRTVLNRLRGHKIMALLLKQRGNGAKIPQYFRPVLIEYFDCLCIALLFETQKDRVKITHDDLVNAAKNARHGGKVIHFLFKIMGFQVQITHKIFRAALKNWGNGKEVLTVLLEKDPDFLDVRGEDGQSPLHIAARYGNSGVVELLLKKGFDWDVKDEEGNTPLIIATSLPLRGDSFGVAQLLLEKGADWRIPREDGRTPLLSASFGPYHEVGNIIRLLLGYGADLDAPSLYRGWTPLHAASSTGQALTIRMLLAEGADRNVPDEDGRLPWEIASCNGYEEAATLLKDSVD